MPMRMRTTSRCPVVAVGMIHAIIVEGRLLVPAVVCGTTIHGRAMHAVPANTMSRHVSITAGLTVVRCRSFFGRDQKECAHDGTGD